MGRLEVSFLGRREVVLDRRPVSFRSTKVESLLAYLLLEADRVHDRRLLAMLLWPEMPDRDALKNLRQALYELRQSLRDSTQQVPFLSITRQTVKFNLQSEHSLDAADFLDSLEQGSLEKAAALYQGELLLGLSAGNSVAFEEWLLVARERYHRLALDVLHRLAQRHREQGDHDKALVYARRQLDLEPWREEAHRQLMLLLAAQGQRSAALAQYATCCRILAAELGVAPTPETVALYEQIKAGAAGNAQESVGSRSLTRPATPPSPHNLPAEATLFVGREREVAHLRTRLAAPECRLLTITGEGGIGKTRLAVRVAMEQVGSDLFSGGVVFVSLVEIDGTDAVDEEIEQQIAATLATALGLSFYDTQPPKRQLLSFLRDKQILLVLDNCEHVLAGMGLIGELLAAAPGVKVLATSRAPLGLQQEWIFPLGGLELPGSDEAAGADMYGAIRLFLQSARRAQPDFELSAENYPSIVRICQAVEGSPLGIELAAAWLRGLTCREIADKIEDSLDFLTSPLRNVPPRHRSMRSVFAHSWRLLSPAERRTLAQATLFQGGFTQEAALAVTGATLWDLTALVAQSLLRRAPEGRYQLHELLRQFAAEHLALMARQQEIDLDATRERHGELYLAFVQQRETALQGERARETLAEIQAELGNIRHAWQWAVTKCRIDMIDRGLNGLSRYYQLTGHFYEGQTALMPAVDAVRAYLRAQEVPEPAGLAVLSRLLIAKAWLLCEQTIADQALVTAQEAVRLAREIGAADLETLGLLECGRALWRQGKHETARTRLEEARARAHRLGLRQVEADCLRNLGNVAMDLTDYTGAMGHLERSLSICREIGDRVGEHKVGTNVGLVATFLGNYEAAERYYEQALRGNRDTGYKHGEAICLENLGSLYYRMGKYQEAREYLQSALELYRFIGDQEGIGLALTYLGDVTVALGALEAATALYRQALWVRQESGQHHLLPETLAGLAHVALLQGTPRQARAYVEEIWPSLESSALCGENPLNVYLVCYRVLAAMQDQRARAVVETANALLQEQANRIDDEEQRRWFLENVAVHREIVQEARRLNALPRSIPEDSGSTLPPRKAPGNGARI